MWVRCSFFDFSIALLLNDSWAHPESEVFSFESGLEMLPFGGGDSLLVVVQVMVGFRVVQRWWYRGDEDRLLDVGMQAGKATEILEGFDGNR